MPEKSTVFIPVALLLLADCGGECWITSGSWVEWLWPDANPQKGLLDRNLLEIPVSEISDAKVTMTVFDGRTVYE